MCGCWWSLWFLTKYMYCWCLCGNVFCRRPALYCVSCVGVCVLCCVSSMRFKAVSGSVVDAGVLLCGSDGLLSRCGPLQRPGCPGGVGGNCVVGGGSSIVVGNVLGREVINGGGESDLVRDSIVSYLRRGVPGVGEGEGGDGSEEGGCGSGGEGFGREYYRHRVYLSAGGFVRDLSRVGPVLDAGLHGLLCADERGVV